MRIERLGLALSVLLTACGANSRTLTVRLITDFVPAAELASVRVDIESIELPDGAEAFSQRLSFVAGEDDDFIHGVDVAELGLPQPGRYGLTVTLLDRFGEVLADQEVEIEIRDAYVATILVDRGCATDPALCDRTCATDDECSVGVTCGVGVCASDHCLFTPIAPGATGACAAGEFCDPVAGCVPRPGPTCSGTEERLCDLQDGVCAGALVACTGGVFPDCGTTQYGARFETTETLCDGLDNDCDGLVDEMDLPACPLTEGVCAGSTRTCGGRLGLLACDFFAHDPRYEPIEQTCDGLDNDCDGVTDEVGRLPECPLRDGVCGGSRGRCEAGTFVCDAAQYGPSFEPDETLCDGLDNDCDRRVDEGLVAPACALSAGVCTGSQRRCGGALGFLACGLAEYGPVYQASTETSCDGLDNDCDGTVDEGITRSCDRGCGSGTETCVDGAFIGCTAPSRTVLSDVSLGGGVHNFECVDVPLGTTATFGSGATIVVANDARVVGSLIIEGRAGRIEARDVVVEGRLQAGELTVVASSAIRVAAGGLLDAIGRYSGGGGGGCSNLSSRGVSGGGAGGSGGGVGGRGGACGPIAGQLGGAGIGGGNDGAVGCDCTCSISSAGGAPSGGDGAAAPAGAGGGGGAGGTGGGGGSGSFPSTGWMASGGLPGSASNPSGARPAFGGGGGGAGGGELSFLGRPDCADRGGGGAGILVLEAPSIVNLGRIALDGSDGAGSTNWLRRGAGGGGGAGALVVLAATFDNLGVVTANGGRGGSHRNHATQQGCPDTSAGGGGGGGGGYVYLEVGALTAGSFGRISVDGGAGGTVECASPRGSPGASGVRCCVVGLPGCPTC